MQVTFTNKSGVSLSGILDEVENPIAQAIYLHCFTCSKNHPASYKLCKALAEQGIQILRFDFTGLGESEGEFSQAGFTNNINDIKAAVEYLEQNHQAPSLLIGHSLGGIAAVAAAGELDNINAVTTIGSPSRPAHVLDHFEQHIPKILKQGFDDVVIFERSLRLTKQYIEDLKKYDDRDFIRELNKPILIFHSPHDDIVSIDEAAKIFMQARHPKSFISLDETDHLISKKQDAAYIAEHIACWSKRYISNI